MPKTKKKTPQKRSGNTTETGLKKRNTSGFYRKVDLDTIDGRTILGRAVTEIKVRLREYLGDSRTIVGEILIQRIAYKTARMARYERNNLDATEDTEVPHYLPMSNSLRLDLIALQQMAGETKPPSLDEFLSTNYGKSEK